MGNYTRNITHVAFGNTSQQNEILPNQVKAHFCYKKYKSYPVEMYLHWKSVELMHFQHMSQTGIKYNISLLEFLFPVRSAVCDMLFYTLSHGGNVRGVGIIPPKHRCQRVEFLSANIKGDLFVFCSESIIKGKVSRDFRPPVFFIRQFPLGPLILLRIRRDMIDFRTQNVFC
jgi:hypothetical protein